MNLRLRLSAPALPVLLLAVSGCSQQAAPLGQSIVGIGSTRADLFGIPPEYRALHVGLESALGRPVRFSAQPNGAAIGRQLKQGNLAYAILTAKEYASAAREAELTLLASAVNSLGRTSRKALIVARATDKRFKTVSDCSGKRFAFGIYGDLLTDVAARQALETSGVPSGKLLPELLPPPFAMEGRLYVQNDAAVKIALDPTVNAGVMDELVYHRLPATGGNPITGPSRDQFKVIGETLSIPEMVVVAGPAADGAVTGKLREFLLTRVRDDRLICEQLGVTGFAAPEPEAYQQIGQLVSKS